MFPARFLDGQTAVPKDVKFVIEHRRISVYDLEGTRVAYWAPSDFFVESLGGRTRIVSAENELISVEITDPDGIRAARVFENKVADRKLLMASLMFAVVGLSASIYLCIPMVSRIAAHQVPFRWEMKVRPTMIQAFEKEICEDKKDSLTRMAAILMGPDAESYPIEIKMIPSKNINAFALPGGLILMHSELIEKADDVTEVAGVLAHEIQHVMQRHIMAEMIQSSFTLALWGFIFGDYTAFLVVDPSTAYKLADLKFSRDLEASADDGAFEMLNRSEIPTSGMARFFRRIGTADKWIPSIISTHPSSEKRAKQAELAGLEPHTNSAAMKKLELVWKDLKNAAENCQEK
ncbi:MAG: M48 family metallopeptidase [Bdellovibrionia bacterium]